MVDNEWALLSEEGKIQSRETEKVREIIYTSNTNQIFRSYGRKD